MMKYKNEDIYIGEWVRDKIEGQGIFIFESGERYEGTFRNNIKDG